MDSITRCLKILGSVKNMIYAEENNQMEVYYERYFNETVIGSRGTFRTPDKKMEP